MIKELILKNFKSISDQTYTFSNFDLLVGRNNSGKSTILQAMAIWQYCVDEFHRQNKNGKEGVQIVLPNFTALPLPEFNLLWNNRIDRKQSKYILIEINLKYINDKGEDGEFGIHLRYQSPQSIYAIPIQGWAEFRKLEASKELPIIVYVPPFSGLEPNEKWLDDGVLRQNVGKGQPGSVLRNLLYRVIDHSMRNNDISSTTKKQELPESWNIIRGKIFEWFDVTLLPPKYEKGKAINIETKYYKEKGKEFDIISGGSGFHQVLTLLAFYYGYEGVTTILFDEPDAHMHVNLQREILNYFKQLKSTQFIIATHAEEFIKGVDPESIYSVLTGQPDRIQSTPAIITALSDVDNMAIVQTQQNPFILYVEGEDDERILNAWASVLKKEPVLNTFYIETLGGTSKKEMKEKADKHFDGLKKINPRVKRLMLFDYDTDETAFHPELNNPSLFEWTRKNIENYLLVPDAWKRAIIKNGNEKELNLLNAHLYKIVDDFFSGQNLTLPLGKTWRNVDANIFTVVDGKKILFEQQNSLFQLLNSASMKINRDTICRSFIPEELHNDVVVFFEKLENLIN